jgi:hypothetical protein
VTARQRDPFGAERRLVQRARVRDRNRRVVFAVQEQDRSRERAHGGEVVEGLGDEPARQPNSSLASARTLVNVDSSTSRASGRSCASAQIAPPPSERPQPAMRARSTPACAAAQSYAATNARVIEACDGDPAERP